VVKVSQRVQVTVVEIDMPRKRIALSMKTKVELAPRGDRKAEAGPRDLKRFTDDKRGGGGKPAAPAPGNDWFTQAMKRK
jgi:uncharacterized protein